eukprot:14078035-Ditylum_brightwellii.AAC.1
MRREVRKRRSSPMMPPSPQMSEDLSRQTIRLHHVSRPPPTRHSRRSASVVFAVFKDILPSTSAR